MDEIKILAIESSCDETAAAVVVNGRDLRSNVISSQIALHTLYGGVVPRYHKCNQFFKYASLCKICLIIHRNVFSFRT